MGLYELACGSTAVALGCAYVGVLYLVPAHIRALPRDHDTHVRGGPAGVSP